jgi:cyclophilin family peptidyl-prolyl cis-trans isomerase
LGNILLDLRPDVAPGHCKNMIGLCRIGFYDSLLFHRVVRGFMVQAGDPRADGTGGPGYTIPPEFNDKKHVPGVLSMARGDAPGSAGSQFFICVAERPDLDGKYTVFGKTADPASLEVVKKISQMPTVNERPTEDIVISSARVIELPK